ncbi:MAG: HAD family hydrolase [Gammaproteobacteria bacterium]|nr:HAD family hydrolase [Gammaproteobacteria bacterium]
MRQIRAITLDLDDTLWEIGPVIRRAESRLWEWLNYHYPRIGERWNSESLLGLRRELSARHADLAHDLRFMRKQVLRHIAVDAGYAEDLVEPAFAVFDKARNEVQFFPDVLPALEALARQFSIIAVTNGNANLDAIGLRHLFRDVVTAVDVGAAKPAAAIFDEAVRRAGVAPHEALHVGDHPELDVDGARNAGLRTAWMNRNGYDWPGHLPEPDLTVSTVTELRQALTRASRPDGG